MADPATSRTLSFGDDLARTSASDDEASGVLNTTAAALAKQIMNIADRHNRNGELTINEMNTFLARTECVDAAAAAAAPYGRHDQRARVTGEKKIFQIQLLAFLRQQQVLRNLDTDSFFTHEIRREIKRER